MPTKKERKADAAEMSNGGLDAGERIAEGIAGDAQGVVEEAQEKFPVVGIGASAGGLAAFETFFTSMPADADPGMAFVLVQHLAPDHKSILTDLIRRCTRMQVFEVEDGIAVKPNCTYIIPPNRDMAFFNGALQLLEPSVPRGQRMPIDYFFRSLAQDRREQAICIVLSGTGSDGTLGVRAIKGEGGMVIAQDPDTTEHDGMPRSAISTGLVDYVLPVAEMPRQLMDYVSHALGPTNRVVPILAQKVDNALKKIFLLLRAQTGNDFSQYKPSTICRRIERRMAVHQIKTINDYVKYLQQSPTEVEDLYRDLLIGVTNFFRDPEAFKVLEQQVVPKLFLNKHEGAVIRIWSACCSTGEEAYSIAMLLQEYMEKERRNYAVQIFATDIDKHAIAAARAGVYPASIAPDIPADRLARFFTALPDGNAYRINKAIRDMIVFSEQNIIRDPPFSRLDLISCRNFLIYLNRDIQKSLVNLFLYSLNPGGILFLGNSENVGESDGSFAALDRKARLFTKKGDFFAAQRKSGDWFFPITMAVPMAPRAAGKTEFPAKRSLREITEQALLNNEDISGVLVNKKGDILYIHGRTGAYLEPAPGEAQANNIVKMAREGLRRELTTALHKTSELNEAVRCPGLLVKTNDHFTPINLSIRPVAENDSMSYEIPLYLVVLEKAPQSNVVILDPSLAGGEHASDGDARVEALTRQLRVKEEYLQATNEELETANEELSSSNEEMQSINEECQSTNEELETSKEELQSINEELTTVNAELQAKVAELSRLNNDMNNMLAGTGIGTVFVDHHLRILRFTPAATEIINLISSDMGRPVSHLASNLVEYDSLAEDVQTVLDTLAHKEEDVQTKAGKWYKMHIQPYRTSDNVIEGAVITFTDTTEMRRMRDELTVSEAQFRGLIGSAKDGILILDAETGMITGVNQSLIDLLGYSEEQLLKKAVWDIGFLKDVIASKGKFSELKRNGYVRYRDLPLETSDGRQVAVEFTGNVYAVNQSQIVQCCIRKIGSRETGPRTSPEAKRAKNGKK